VSKLLVVEQDPDVADGLERIAESRPAAALLDVDGPGGAGVADLEQIAQPVGTPCCLGPPHRIATVTALVQRAPTERHAPVPEPRAPA